MHRWLVSQNASSFLSFFLSVLLQVFVLIWSVQPVHTWYAHPAHQAVLQLPSRSRWTKLRKVRSWTALPSHGRFSACTSEHLSGMHASYTSVLSHLIMWTNYRCGHSFPSLVSSLLQLSYHPSSFSPPSILSFELSPSGSKYPSSLLSHHSPFPLLLYREYNTMYDEQVDGLAERRANPLQVHTCNSHLF